MRKYISFVMMALCILSGAGGARFLPAPVFDSGTSLWYDKLTREIAFNAPIEMKPFYADGSRQLELVTDFGWIPFANLIDLKDDITEVFAQSDRMEEERMKAIAKATSMEVEFPIKMFAIY